MIISIVVAMDKNNGIGYKNHLPWHISSELKYFKKITLEKPIIMGRKTFFSIGQKALAKRKNIILTKDKTFNNKDIEIAHSVKEALSKACAKECMVIGGQEIYKLFLPLAHRLYISLIFGQYLCDTFFPKIDFSQWHLLSEEKNADFVAQVWQNNRT